MHNDFLKKLYDNTSYEDLHTPMNNEKFEKMMQLGIDYFSNNILIKEDDWLKDKEILLSKKETLLEDKLKAFDYTNDILISDKLKSFLFRVEDLLNSKEYFEDLGTLNSEIAIILKQEVDKSHWTNDELTQLYISFGVVCASYEFWSNNALLWKMYPTKAPWKRKIAELAMADMTGAAWGSTLPGAGTAFGAALGSGLMAWSWD